MASDRRSRRLLSLALFAVAAVAMAWAFWTSYQSTEPDVWPPFGHLAVAAGLSVLSLFCAARVWVSLLDREGDPAVLAGSLYRSQMAKYFPAGGFAQVASQVVLARHETVTLARAGMAWPLFAGVTVVSAAVVAGVTAPFADGLPSWLRWLLLLGLVSPVLLIRGVAETVVRVARRVIRRLPDPELLPPQRAIWLGFAWSLPMMALTAAAFTTLLRPVAPEVDVATAAAAFVVAWSAGFLAVPVPGGLGVREAVLVALLSPTAAATVIGVAVVHRLVLIVAELVMVAGNSALRRRRAR